MAEGQHLIQVNVNFCGKSISVNLSEDSTIEQLKDLLLPLTGVLPHCQKLIFGGKVLEDGKTLRQSGVTQGLQHQENCPLNKETRPKVDRDKKPIAVKKDQFQKRMKTGVLGFCNCNPEIKPEEITGFMKDFDEPGYLDPTGLHLAGTKYMVIQGEPNAVIRGKKTKTGDVFELDGTTECLKQLFYDDDDDAPEVKIRSTICVICQYPWNNREVVSVLMPCGHMIHKACDRVDITTRCPFENMRINSRRYVTLCLDGESTSVEQAEQHIRICRPIWPAVHPSLNVIDCSRCGLSRFPTMTSCGSCSAIVCVCCRGDSIECVCGCSEFTVLEMGLVDSDVEEEEDASSDDDLYGMWYDQACT